MCMCLTTTHTADRRVMSYENLSQILPPFSGDSIQYLGKIQSDDDPESMVSISISFVFVVNQESRNIPSIPVILAKFTLSLPA